MQSSDPPPPPPPTNKKSITLVAPSQFRREKEYHIATFKNCPKFRCSSLNSHVKMKPDRKENPGSWTILTGEGNYVGRKEGSTGSSTYCLLTRQGPNIQIAPVSSFFTFRPTITYSTYSLEEAEAQLQDNRPLSSLAQKLISNQPKLDEDGAVKEDEDEIGASEGLMRDHPAHRRGGRPAAIPTDQKPKRGRKSGVKAEPDVPRAPLARKGFTNPADPIQALFGDESFDAEAKQEPDSGAWDDTEHPGGSLVYHGESEEREDSDMFRISLGHGEAAPEGGESNPDFEANFADDEEDTVAPLEDEAEVPVDDEDDEAEKELTESGKDMKKLLAKGLFGHEDESDVDLSSDEFDPDDDDTLFPAVGGQPKEKKRRRRVKRPEAQEGTATGEPELPTRGQLIGMKRQQELLVARRKKVKTELTRKRQGAVTEDNIRMELRRHGPIKLRDLLQIFKASLTDEKQKNLFRQYIKRHAKVVSIKNENHLVLKGV
eukprot:gnl/Trimastix_PCT/1396.p1 GENE.gnl/Trimastix_PCT/1396~~gnl/Trimastix_PCT/1396.p1  ORF type:complete len:488 (+),score=142.59 gnl/Trimastix_PCT/1396:67-1530(+)